MSRQQPDFFRQPARLQAYLDGLTQAAGHADRVVPIENYTKGLMLPIERKSVEPMAARLAPGNVRQMHQSLHHIVADAAWSDDALLKQVHRQVLPAMTRKHALAAWIVDDTGFPRRAPIRLESRASTAVSWASRRTAGWPSAYRLPPNRPVFPRAIGSIFPRSGPAIQSGASKQAYPKRFASRPSRRLRSDRSARWSQKVCRMAWCWPMLPMATTMDSARDWKHWNFPVPRGIQSTTTVWPPEIVPLPPQPQGKMRRPPRRFRRGKH